MTAEKFLILLLLNPYGSAMSKLNFPVCLTLDMLDFSPVTVLWAARVFFRFHEELLKKLSLEEYLFNSSYVSGWYSV